MVYNEWKSALVERRDQNDLTVEYYWPENDNFEKLAKPFVKDENGNVYDCKSMFLPSTKDVENMIETCENIGIHYIDNTLRGVVVRFIDFNESGISPTTVEDFYDQNKEEMTFLGTTIDDLKEKMNQVTELDYIFIKRHVKKVNEVKIFIDKILTDGQYLYV